jgi:hypothetical protein
MSLSIDQILQLNVIAKEFAAVPRTSNLPLTDDQKAKIDQIAQEFAHLMSSSEEKEEQKQKAQAEWIEQQRNNPFYIHDSTLNHLAPKASLWKGLIPTTLTEALSLVESAEESVSMQSENSK